MSRTMRNSSTYNKTIAHITSDAEDVLMLFLNIITCTKCNYKKLLKITEVYSRCTSNISADWILSESERACYLLSHSILIYKRTSRMFSHPL